MKDFLQYVLQKIDFDPKSFGNAYGTKLTHQEELMLSRLNEEIGMRVEAMLEKALVSAQPEIIMNEAERGFVMELTSIRKAIHNLILERGSLGQWKEGLN